LSLRQISVRLGCTPSFVANPATKRCTNFCFLILGESAEFTL